MTHADWQFKAALDVRLWSFGRVGSKEELYSQRIFGAARDGACECGKYAEARYEGIICDRCGVKVLGDAMTQRRRRLGHIELAFPCRHPLASSEHPLLDTWPIAPIAFRVEDDRVTELGEKYERLIELNHQACEALPPRNSVEYFSALKTYDPGSLEDVIATIVGRPESEDACLLKIVMRELAAISPASAALIRSCALSLSMNLTA